MKSNQGQQPLRVVWVVNDEGRELVLKYYLSEKCCQNAYDIRIEKFLLTNKSLVFLESAVTCFIDDGRLLAHQFVSRLADGVVTPISLGDIADDMDDMCRRPYVCVCTCIA